MDHHSQLLAQTVTRLSFLHRLPEQHIVVRIVDLTIISSNKNYYFKDETCLN